RADAVPAVAGRRRGLMNEHRHEDEHARAGHAHGPNHPPEHTHDHGPSGHTHGAPDPPILSTARRLWTLKWSFVGLLAPPLVQAGVVALSGSVALLADTIHNFADAATAIPLGVAFMLARRGVTRRFTYGLGRVEDLAGLMIVATIAVSALVASYEAIQRLQPQPIDDLRAVVGGAVVGVVGNDAAAVVRLLLGRQIGSGAGIAGRYPPPRPRGGLAEPGRPGRRGRRLGRLPSGRSGDRPRHLGCHLRHRLAVGPDGAGPRARCRGTRDRRRDHADGRSRRERRGSLGRQGPLGWPSLARRAARHGAGGPVGRRGPRDRHRRATPDTTL